MGEIMHKQPKVDANVASWLAYRHPAVIAVALSSKTQAQLSQTQRDYDAYLLFFESESFKEESRHGKLEDSLYSAQTLV